VPYLEAYLCLLVRRSWRTSRGTSGRAYQRTHRTSCRRCARGKPVPWRMHPPRVDESATVHLGCLKWTCDMHSCSQGQQQRLCSAAGLLCMLATWTQIGLAMGPAFRLLLVRIMCMYQSLLTAPLLCSSHSLWETGRSACQPRGLKTVA